MPLRLRKRDRNDPGGGESQRHRPSHLADRRRQSVLRRRLVLLRQVHPARFTNAGELFLPSHADGASADVAVLPGCVRRWPAGRRSCGTASGCVPHGRTGAANRPGQGRSVERRRRVTRCGEGVGLSGRRRLYDEPADRQPGERQRLHQQVQRAVAVWCHKSVRCEHAGSPGSDAGDAGHRPGQRQPCEQLWCRLPRREHGLRPPLRPGCRCIRCRRPPRNPRAE